MRTLLVSFLAVILAIAAHEPVSAQSPPGTRIRATIESIDGATLALRSRSGESVTLKLKEPLTVSAVVPAKFEDIRTGEFVGVSAEPGEGGVLKALEVHIIPEAMRGSGEGFHPFDLTPTSTMTNGAITAKVDGVSGPVLTVTYKGGEQKIVVDAKTPVVTFDKGDPSDLKPGAGVIVFSATKGVDGAYEANRILVGRGVMPPM